MLLAVWLAEDRKCSAAVVGLDLLLGLSMVRRCSLNRSFKRHFVSPMYCKLQWLHIIKKHFNLLLSSNRCKSVFQHLPVVAFRRSPNLHDLLVTAKLPFNSTNPQVPSGSFRCGKNCATCPYISHGLTTYTFFSTRETHPITLFVKLKPSSI